MSSVDAKNVNEVSNQVTRKRRRGINNETRATSRLKFNEKTDANRANGLFLGHLDSVEVSMVTIGADTTGMPTFTGLEVPRITFTFASNGADLNARKYLTHSLMPVESNAETIPGGKNEWQVNSVLSFIKHIMDVFIFKGREMTEDEEDLLCLPFEDFVEDNGKFVYEPIDAEEVIKGWTTLFNNAANMLNGVKDDAPAKPTYMTANGGILPIWIKLLRFNKVKGEWRPIVRGKSTMGDLGFGFVGTGLIELYKDGVAPLLSIDFTKESIIPREIKTAKAPMTPNMPGMPGMAMGGGVNIEQPMGGNFGGSENFGAFSPEETDDSPF